LSQPLSITEINSYISKYKIIYIEVFTIEFCEEVENEILGNFFRE